MATEVALRTFEDILNDIVRRGKIATSIDDIEDDDLTAIKSYVNQRYQEVSFSKQWNWREETRLIEIIPKYTTGTAAVTNGQRQVTLSAAATVTESFDKRYFRVSGDTQYYRIISVSSTASRTLELDTPYIGTTDATATYEIFKPDYALWPDFADLYDVRLWGTIVNNPLDSLSSEEMMEMISKYGPGNATYPTHYCIGGMVNYYGPPMGANFIMGYDFMGTDPNLSISFYPMILQQKIVGVKYGKQVTNLVEDSDEPLIPLEKRKVLVYGALADWFSMQRNETSQALWIQLFNAELGKMKADFDKTTKRPVLKADNPYRRRYSRLPIRFVTSD